MVWQVNLLFSVLVDTDKWVFPLSQHLLLSLVFNDSPRGYWLYFLGGQLADEKRGLSLWNKFKRENNY